MTYGFARDATIITARERRILLLRCNGYNAIEIGRAMGCSAGTVKNILKIVFGKLRVPSTTYQCLPTALMLSVALGIIKVSELENRHREATYGY